MPWVGIMSNSLLEKLMAAQTDEERNWIVTDNLLKSLPTELAKALWAVAIPHWFNGEILVALCPDLADSADDIYLQLQELSCVEVFPDRGHNVHEMTRNQLLDRLWKDSPEYFRELSNRAAEYFAQTHKPESQIEWIYQLAVADPKRCIREISHLANDWQNAFRRAEIDSLTAFLQTQIRANRTTIAVKAETIYWDGRIKFRFYQSKEAIESYEAAQALYREMGYQLGEARILKVIGDVLQFLKRLPEAIESYEAALALYREIGYQLGEANTLKAIGDVLRFLNRSTEAIEMYETALALYRKIGIQLGEANTLQAIGDVLQFLKRSTEVLEGYEAALAFYREIGDLFLKHSTVALERYEGALAFYRKISDRLGEANTLKSIGDVLRFLNRSTEAIETYEAALAICSEISDQLGQAKILQAIGDVLQFLDHCTEALERYEAALAIYHKIGDRLGEANTLKSIGDVLQLLDHCTEVLKRYESALAIYREIGDHWGEANILQAIAILDEDPVNGLANSQAALNLYIEIGDKHSQGVNLILFTSEIQLKLGQKAEAISSLTLAAKLAQEINYQPMVDYANQKIAEINRDSQGIRG